MDRIVFLLEFLGTFYCILHFSIVSMFFFLTLDLNQFYNSQISIFKSIKLLQVFSVLENGGMIEFRKMDYQETKENCWCSLRVLSRATKIFCPTRSLNGAPGISSVLKLPWGGQPADTLAGSGEPDLAHSRGLAAGPSREPCFAWCLASKKFAGCCWPKAGLPGTSPYSAAPQGCGLWLQSSQLPPLESPALISAPRIQFLLKPISLQITLGLQMTAGWLSAPGRWLLSTLADLCIWTSWLCQALGLISCWWWRTLHLNYECVCINIQATTASWKSLPRLHWSSSSIWSTGEFEKNVLCRSVQFPTKFLFYILLKAFQHNLTIRSCPLFKNWDLL